MCRQKVSLCHCQIHVHSLKKKKKKDLPPLLLVCLPNHLFPKVRATLQTTQCNCYENRYLHRDLHGENLCSLSRISQLGSESWVRTQVWDFLYAKFLFVGLVVCLVFYFFSVPGMGDRPLTTGGTTCSLCLIGRKLIFFTWQKIFDLPLVLVHLVLILPAEHLLNSACP